MPEVTTAQVNKFLDANRDTINKINERIMESSFRPVSTIYTDLNCFKDTRLGYLIYKCKDDPVKMKYLKDNLDKYNLRPQRSFTLAYPELGFKEEECLKEYLDPNLSDCIFNFSPDTDFSINLDAFLSQCDVINDRIQFRAPIKFYINLYPLRKTPLINRFLDMLQHYVGANIQVIPLNTRPKEVSAEIWLQGDYIFLDDISDLIVDDSTFVTTLAKEDMSTTRHVIAAYQATDQQIEEWTKQGFKMFDSESQAAFFAVVASYYSLITDFTFVTFKIPLEEEGR